MSPMGGSKYLASAALVALLCAHAPIAITAEESPATHKPDWVMPVLNAMMCTLTADAWSCGREQAARILDVFGEEMELTKQSIKAEADKELAEKISQRGFSASEDPKEKPSEVMTTLDDYVTNGIYSVLGRMKHSHQKPTSTVQNVQVSAVPLIQPAQVATPSDEHHTDDDDEDDDDDEPAVEEGHGHGGHIHTPLAGAQHSRPARRPFRVGLKPLKHKYGRDLGVTRGKKHKKKFKKALMKLLVIGTILKAKLEFLLKIVGTHLQIKFFIVALISLLINVAKFWIDLKKGHQPQKVIYYEHAQHQHHYDEHDDGWGGGGGYWKRSLDQADDDTPSLHTGEVDASRMADVAGSYAHLNNGPLPNVHSLAYNRQLPSQI